MKVANTVVDVLLLPKCNLILVSALSEPLRAANRLMGATRFETRLVSLDGEPVETTAGVPLPVVGRFDPGHEAPLLVAASYDVERFTERVRHPMRRAVQHRPFIAAADGAVRLLSECGVYDGHQVAFHAEDVESLGQRCPGVLLSQRRWVIDRNRASARGSGSAIELMLALIERWADRSLAEAVARLFDFVPADNLGTLRDATRGLRDDRVARVLNAMASHMTDPLTVSQLAAQIGVSSRGLRGLFERELGRSPGECYLQLRMERAKQLLTETDWSVSAVAQQCGYAQTASLTRAYRRHFGENPLRARAR
ncbi:MAG: helix-turn-helix domain-containing protein [Pseudomonadota bacterium]